MLRREPTEAEKRLWSILRDRQRDGANFRRQHPIPPFVADFACVEARLIVEVDSGHHADKSRDADRDAYLQRHGWRRGPFRQQRAAERPRRRGPADSPSFLPAPAAGAQPSPAAEQAALPRATAIAPPAPPPTPSPSPTTTATAAACASRPTPASPSSSTSPRPSVLRDGDLLALDDGRLVLVRAAPEAVLDIQAADALALARIAWHLGNRHTPTQILPGSLRIRADHVLEHLLTDHLGATVTHATAPFDPEGGAYGHGGHEH